MFGGTTGDGERDFRAPGPADQAYQRLDFRILGYHLKLQILSHGNWKIQWTLLFFHVCIVELGVLGAWDSGSNSCNIGVGDLWILSTGNSRARAFGISQRSTPGPRRTSKTMAREPLK